MSDATPPATPVRWGQLVAIGAAAGAASGLFGVGGGSITVPALVLVAGFGQKLATGTSLTAVVPIAAAALVGYLGAGSVDLTRGSVIALGSLAGAMIGTRLMRRSADRWLQFGFALLLVATGVRMLLAEPSTSGAGEIDAVGVVALLALGLTAGVLAGLFGVGGGIIIVPALTLLGGLDVAVAKGTSLLAIIPPAILATMANRSAGLTALRPAMAVGLSGVVSAVVVATLAVRLDGAVATAAFAVFLVVIAARMALNALRTPPDV